MHPSTPRTAQHLGRAGRAHHRLALLLAVCCLGAAAAPAASMAAQPQPARSAGSTALDPRAVAAMAEQKGISVAQAKIRLGKEHALGEKGKRIEKALAGDTGGSFLDGAGNLVVTTTDAGEKAVVTREGAKVKVVDDSAAKLDSIMKQLDAQAAKTGAGKTQGWRVDVPSNTLVLTVTDGAHDPATAAIEKLAKSFGASVRIESKPASEQPRPAEWMVGGYEFLMADRAHVCSVGFNAVDAYNRSVVLTAGHCTKTAGMISRNGYSIGNTRTANYPGDDFGTFWNSYPGYWKPSISVSKWNGTYANVVGQWDTPPVGAAVCKSGRTTGFTCGTIRAINQTVVYTGGIVVSGLVRHDACVQGGDSGGSNISAGNYALGVTSGAKTTTVGGLCMRKVGEPNVSWYQPVGEALRANGLRLLL